jgi:hypothetical protein
MDVRPGLAQGGSGEFLKIQAKISAAYLGDYTLEGVTQYSSGRGVL